MLPWCQKIMRTEKQEKMFALVEQWKTSSMTQKQFCAHYNIKLATFSYWVGRYRRAEHSEQDDAGFVRIQDQTTFTSQNKTAIELIYPNGVRLTLNAADPGHIAQLIHLW